VKIFHSAVFSLRREAEGRLAEGAHGLAINGECHVSGVRCQDRDCEVTPVENYTRSGRAQVLVELSEVQLGLAWREQQAYRLWGWLGGGDLLVAAGTLENDREGFICSSFYLYPFNKKS